MSASGSRNEAIVAARYARHRLPPDWGGSAARPAPRAQAAAAPRPRTAADRVLDVLRAMAEAGVALPTLRELGARAGLPHGNPGSTVADLLHVLLHRGAIDMWIGPREGWSRARAIRLRDSGAVLRTPGAPTVTLW